MRKISIITVSFNSASTIRDTIESVLSQSYPNIEYIIVDGVSTDGTQKIIESYGPKVDCFISEKDKGLYDAMNKGIRVATGDIIGILNSDDVYFNSHILQKVADAFEKNEIEALYGDLIYFQTEKPDVVKRYYKGGQFSLKRVSYGLMPPHPTFFVLREVYEKFGMFDISFTLSADFDLILRFLGVHKISFLYLPEVLVKMRLGGKSTSSLKRIIIMNGEDLRSCKKNGVKTYAVKFYLKYFNKVVKFIFP